MANCHLAIDKSNILRIRIFRPSTWSARQTRVIKRNLIFVDLQELEYKKPPFSKRRLFVLRGQKCYSVCNIIDVFVSPARKIDDDSLVAR